MYKPLTFAVATLTAVQACSTQIGTDGAYFDLCSLYKEGGYVSPVVPGTSSNIRITFNYCRRYEASQNNGANAAAWFSSFYARNQWGDMIADQDIDEAFSTEAIMTDDKITGVNVVQLASYWGKKDLPQCHLRSIINCDETISDLDPNTIIPSKVAEPGCEYIMEFSHKSGCPVAKPEPLPAIVQKPLAGSSQGNPMIKRYGDETDCQNAVLNYWNTGTGFNKGYNQSSMTFGAELNFLDKIEATPSSKDLTAQWCIKFPGVDETLDCMQIDYNFTTTPSQIGTDSNGVAVTSSVSDTYGEDYVAQKFDGSQSVNWTNVGEPDTTICATKEDGEKVTCPNFKVEFERSFNADSLVKGTDVSFSEEMGPFTTLVAFGEWLIPSAERDFDPRTDWLKAQMQAYTDSEMAYHVLHAEYTGIQNMLELSLREIDGTLLVLDKKFYTRFGNDERTFVAEELTKQNNLWETTKAAKFDLKAELDAEWAAHSSYVALQSQADWDQLVLDDPTQKSLFNSSWDYDLEAFALRLTNKTGQDKLTEVKNLIKENQKTTGEIMELYDRLATYQKYGFEMESAVSMAGYTAATVAATVYALMI